MLERGLAYRKKALVNWCPRVRHRAGERASGGWLLLAPRIDAGGAARARAMVPAHHRLRRRIARDIARTGRRLAGARAHRCSATGSAARKARRSISRWKATDEPIRVFTTRVDTIYGATCVILAPEHPLVAQLARCANGNAQVPSR